MMGGRERRSVGGENALLDGAVAGEEAAGGDVEHALARPGAAVLELGADLVLALHIPGKRKHKKIINTP